MVKLPLTRKSRITTDPKDPELRTGADEAPRPQSEKYLVLSDEELAKGLVRPFRRTYTHTACGMNTSIGFAIAETFARQPDFYATTYCVECQKHRPVAEFVWARTLEPVGT